MERKEQRARDAPGMQEQVERLPWLPAPHAGARGSSRGDFFVLYLPLMTTGEVNGRR